MKVRVGKNHQAVIPTYVGPFRSIIEAGSAVRVKTYGLGIVVRCFPDVKEYDIEFLQNDSHIVRVQSCDLRVCQLKQDDLRDERWCEKAASTGDIELIKFGYTNGHSLKGGMMSAIRNGYWECVKYMHGNGCEWPIYACKQAIQHGHLHLVSLLHDHGCPWDDLTIPEAVRCGHLDVVKYARNHGCQWGDDFLGDLCELAAINGNVELMQYLTDNFVDAMFDDLSRDD